MKTIDKFFLIFNVIISIFIFFIIYFLNLYTQTKSNVYLIYGILFLILQNIYYLYGLKYMCSKYSDDDCNKNIYLLVLFNMFLITLISIFIIFFMKNKNYLFLIISIILLCIYGYIEGSIYFIFNLTNDINNITK